MEMSNELGTFKACAAFSSCKGLLISATVGLDVGTGSLLSVEVFQGMQGLVGTSSDGLLYPQWQYSSEGALSALQLHFLQGYISALR